MIIQLGSFQFSTNMSYDTLERVAGWRWEGVPIAGDYPILQFAGKETPSITFSGDWWNYVAKGDEVQTLEDLANETEPLAVTDDQGKFHGFWVIESLRGRGEGFRQGQQSAIKTSWTLTIKFYGNKKERI